MEKSEGTGSLWNVNSWHWQDSALFLFLNLLDFEGKIKITLKLPKT